MKSEIEITEIVKRHGGKHLQFGNVPSWVDKNQQEGLELKAGILKSFWIKDSARVYDEPISDSWGKCLVEVLDNPKKEEEKKTEQLPGFDKEVHDSNMAFLEQMKNTELHHHVKYMETDGEDVVCHVSKELHESIHSCIPQNTNKDIAKGGKSRLEKNHDSIKHISIKEMDEYYRNRKVSVAVLEGIVPDTLTIPLLEKWKKMSTFERILMFQNTPADRIEERKGFKKSDGSYEMLKFVKGNFMLQEANIAFLFNWSSKIEGINIGATAVAVYGSISVEIDGKQVTRACVGVDEINSKVTAQHAIKNATTDMIKKGFASLGFNGDVYRGEV